MNIFLLKKVRAAILEHPENFNVNDWYCGTTACIAGWVVRIGGGNEADVFHEACRLLKISVDQGNRLFLSSLWPDVPFRSIAHIMDIRCDICDGDVTAEQAAKRIDRFIASDGRE